MLEQNPEQKTNEKTSGRSVLLFFDAVLSTAQKRRILCRGQPKSLSRELSEVFTNVKTLKPQISGTDATKFPTTVHRVETRSLASNEF